MCGFVDGATILKANYRLDPNFIDQSQVAFDSSVHKGKSETDYKVQRKRHAHEMLFNYSSDRPAGKKEITSNLF